MSLYNLSEFITTIKEDIGIKDIPLPVTDKDLIDRFNRSALTDFSVIYPRLQNIRIGQENLRRHTRDAHHIYYEYQVPPYEYAGTTIIDISSFDVLRPNGYSDFYIPNANWSSPDAVIGAMADVRMSAGLASAMAKAPTADFIKPDIIRVFNGWSAGCYDVELLLKHDLSLATIEEGAFPDLRQLAALDMEAYLYNKLKRKDGLEV